MARSNLAVNPSAINGAAGWQTGGEITRLTGLTGTPRPTGAAITISGAWTSSLAGGRASAGLTAGDTVSAVGWVRTSVARALRLYLSVYRGATFLATVQTGRVDIDANADTWYRVRLVQALPGGDWDGVYFHIDGPTNATSTISLSSVRIEKTDDPNLDYADGDTPGWAWDGTAGDSTSAEADEPEPEPEPPLDDDEAGAYPGAPGFYPGAVTAYPSYRGGEEGPWTPPEPTRVAPRPPALVVDAPRSSWMFGIGPAREGGITHELPQTTGRKLSVKLADPSEASFEMDGRDPVALHVDELATDLHVLYRRSPFDVRQQLYRGRIGKAADQIDAESHRLSVPSLDYRGVLQRRFLFTGTQQTWTQIDQVTIGWGLITQTQNSLGGGLGITDASTPTGKLRDRTYDLQDQIFEKIQQLSEVQDGFDWDIVAADTRRLEYRTWFPQRGTDTDVVFELGGSAIALSRDVDSSAYANAIRMTGKAAEAPEGGGEAPPEPPPHERYADNITTTATGRWEAVVGSDLTTAAAINDRIGWQLAQSQVVRPSYSFTMRRGWWQGPEHCWVGDRALVKVFSGRLRVDTVLRVQEMSFTPDPDGGEAVEVTVGAPKPDPRRRATAIEQRLAALERR